MKWVIPPKTGWPDPPLLQDDHPQLSKWLAKNACITCLKRKTTMNDADKRASTLLQGMMRDVENVEKHQAGYQYALGWNAALQLAMDYVRGGALHPPEPLPPLAKYPTDAAGKPVWD